MDCTAGGGSESKYRSVVGRSGRYGVVGAISRDHTGTFLGASAVVFGTIGDPATLKAMAARETLDLYDDLQLQTIHIAYDCRGVVEEIRTGSGAAHGAIIQEIFRTSMILILVLLLMNLGAQTMKLTI